MDNKKNKIINLIVEELPELDIGCLSKVYSYIFDLKGNPESARSLYKLSSSEIIEEFLNCYNTISSDNTKSNYRSVLGKFLKNNYPDISDIKISDYIRIKIKEWKPNTQSRNIIIINRFLQFLYEKGYTPIDLSKVVKAPKRVATVEFCPNDEQVNKLIFAIDVVFNNAREINLYSCIFRLYAKTGMRRNELLNLNVEDLDFEGSKIIVRKTKNKDDRSIPIDSSLEQLLRKYLNFFKYDVGPLFRGKMGKRLVRRSLASAFSKLKKASGMPKKFRLHSFRRYFANVLRKNGVDIATISHLLGHHDIKTTMRYFNIEYDEMMAAMASVNL